MRRGGVYWGEYFFQVGWGKGGVGSVGGERADFRLMGGELTPPILSPQ